MKNYSFAEVCSEVWTLILCVVAGTALGYGCNQPVHAEDKPPVPIIAVAPWLPIVFTAYNQTGASPLAPDLPTDQTYLCLSRKQINAMKKEIRLKQHLDYIAEAWDCDDQAREWCVLAHRWAIDNVTGKFPVALAAFVCYVDIHPGAFDGSWQSEGKHALGLICDEGGVWWFIETQSGAVMKAQEGLFEGTVEARKILW